MPKGIYKRADDLSEKIIEGKRPGYVAVKEKVRKLYEEGVTPKNIEKMTGVSRSTIKKWVIALPKHSKGVSGRPRGYAAQRVAKLTGRDGEVVRQEMIAKENDPCFFCGSAEFEVDGRGWFTSCFHHYDDGTIDRSHKACNAVHAHVTLPGYNTTGSN